MKDMEGMKGADAAERPAEKQPQAGSNCCSDTHFPFVQA